MYTELPDILPPDEPLTCDSEGYTFKVDVSPEFAGQLEGKRNAYVELMDGRIIPLYDVDYVLPVITVPISFTSNSAL